MNILNGLDAVVRGLECAGSCGGASASKGVGVPAGEIHRSKPGADVTDFSGTALKLAQDENVPDARSERVVRVRAEIAEGRYETQEKIAAAAERLFAEMNAVDVSA